MYDQHTSYSQKTRPERSAQSPVEGVEVEG